MTDDKQNHEEENATVDAEASASEEQTAQSLLSRQG